MYQHFILPNIREFEMQIMYILILYIFNNRSHKLSVRITVIRCVKINLQNNNFPA